MTRLSTTANAAVSSANPRGAAAGGKKPFSDITIVLVHGALMSLV